MRIIKGNTLPILKINLVIDIILLMFMTASIAILIALIMSEIYFFTLIPLCLLILLVCFALSLSDAFKLIDSIRELKEKERKK